MFICTGRDNGVLSVDSINELLWYLVEKPKGSTMSFSFKFMAKPTISSF
jgi:hypothetical protein